LREKPDLIIIDYNMPVMDGITMLRKLREETDFKKTEVIMLTGDAGMQILASVARLGVRDCVIKPFSEDELLAKALRRGLADVELPMGDARFKRSALPYTLWMAQRTLDVYQAMSPADQNQVHAWLSSLGGERLLAMTIPRLRLQGLRVLPERQF
jgi:DNA-binding response OmpR family regulator